jgi:hypothetical protein
MARLGREEDMNDSIFSGTAQVEIQGPRVLEFVSINEKQAEFEVIGISGPKIKLIDSRPAVRRKMEEILKTEKVEQLADCFNRPARVTILPPESGEMIVRLEKTRAKKPRHMLWVAVGIGEEIPFYEYKRIDIQQLTDKTFSLFSLYKRPREENS